LAFEKENPPDALVRGLAEECEKLRKGLVEGCDANAHHTQWGCPNNNDRGESLFDFILNSNLFLCLFNRAKAGNEDTNWQNYKHEQASYKKAIRRAIRTAWQTFCSDIGKTSDAARLRKILSKTAAPLGYLQKANGSWSDSSKESVDLLLDAHFPGSQQTGHPPEREAVEGIELDPLLSDRNMKLSIHSFKPYKSPGPDGITPAHIQQAGQIAINWLKKIFQSILAVG